MERSGGEVKTWPSLRIRASRKPVDNWENRSQVVKTRKCSPVHKLLQKKA